jgi:hypothetical protein
VRAKTDARQETCGAVEPLSRCHGETTSFVVLAAAMIVNFVLWWAILTSAAWVGDSATSVVVAAVRHGPAASH